MAAIFGEGKFFLKLQRLHCLDTLCVEILGEGKFFFKLPKSWVENFDEISRTVKEIEAN